MVNIKDYPLRKLADFLQFAYEKEFYERWMTLYPLMEAGFMPYCSFKDYKKKIKENASIKRKNKSMTDEQILKEGKKIVEIYEKNQQKAGEKVGNI